MRSRAHGFGDALDGGLQRGERRAEREADVPLEAGAAGGAAPALKAQTGAEVQELVASSQLGISAGGSVPRWRMAGVVGALLS